MIRLMNILHELSVNTNSAEGEPDAGYIQPNKIRKLAVDVNKPEPWFERGGYTQLHFPKADDMYKNTQDEKVPKVTFIKKINNVQSKYVGFNAAIGSWDKYGNESYISTSIKDYFQ